MKAPTEILRDEHVLILRALDLLEIASGRSESGRPAPEGWWAGLIAWLRAFADRNHHAKEERALFPAMAQAGIPAGDGGPLAVMQDEHEQGRALMQTMMDSGARPRALAARRYIELLRAHIDKEHGILFPLADDILDQAALAREFDTLAAEIGRDASFDHAAAALEELASMLAGRSTSAASVPEMTAASTPAPGNTPEPARTSPGSGERAGGRQAPITGP
jgi:hemerythrin-like domain-containing protein